MSKYLKLEKISKKFKALQKERNLEQEKIAKILVPKFKKDFVGKCYKYKNSYGSSSDEKPWYYYIKITNVTDINFYSDSEPEPSLEVFAFQLTPDNRFEIEMKADRYGRSLDYNEITLEEFNKAYKACIDVCNKEIDK